MTETYSYIIRQKTDINVRMEENNMIRTKLKFYIETRRKLSKQYNAFVMRNTLHDATVRCTGVNAAAAGVSLEVLARLYYSYAFSSCKCSLKPNVWSKSVLKRIKKDERILII